MLCVLSSSFISSPIVFADQVSSQGVENARQSPKVVVTATRLENGRGAASTSVTVITAEEIRKSAASNLADLLGTKAGVNTRSLYGGGSYSEVGLRGFGVNDSENTLILLDGRRLNEMDLSGVNLAAIPIENIERIEIMRGTGSVLYGDGAVGGAINIITKSPQPGLSTGKISSELGSYGHRAIAASGSSGGEQSAVHAYVSRHFNEGYRTNNALEQIHGALDLRHYLDSAELYLKVSANDYNIGLPGARKRNPGAGLDQIGNDPRGASTPINHAEEKSENLVLGSAIELSEKNRLILDWGWRHKNQASFYAPNTIGDTELKTVSFTPRLQSSALADVDVTMGLDHYVTDYVGEWRGSFPSRHDIDVENIAYYVHAEQVLNENTTVNYGARMQAVSYEAVDKLGTNPIGNRTFREPSYDLGLARQIDAVYGLYFHYNRAVRFVTVDEMDSWSGMYDILEPQTSNNFEVGLRSNWRNVRGRYSVYYMQLNNEIAYSPAMFNNINLEPTQRKGYEIELSSDLSTQTSLDLSYTYQQSLFREGANAGKRVPLVPAHNASLALIQQLSDQHTASALLNYTGRYFMDNDQANEAKRAPSFTTVDLKLMSQFDQLGVTLAINNVFDNQGFSYAIKGWNPGEFNAYPLPERNANLRLSYDF